jgi:pimeloyl-ACP methyl ester carboxylesterase
MRDNSDRGGWYDFEGHRIGYRREGAGPPMVFFPNAVASHRLWDYQIEHFRTSHDVLALNPLGLGQSDRPLAAYPLELYVRLLERFVDDLGLAPVVLVGNCIGSLASLHYTAEHPTKVSALILLNTQTREAAAAGALSSPGIEVVLRLRRLRPLLAWYMRHMPRWRIDRFPYITQQFGDTVDQEYRDQAREVFGDPRNRLVFLQLGYASDSYVLPDPDRLSGLPPVCWLWGEQNRILPLEVGQRMAQTVGPTEEHVVQGAGHALARERPDEVNRIIDQFLARHDPDRGGTAATAAVAR